MPAGAPFATRPQPEPPLRIPDDIQQLLKPLAAAATNAWRAKTKMTDAATGEPLEEMRRVYRFVEGIFAALGDAGVRVLDSTGKVYDSGMALKVISFERVPGLGREEVIETIRPSVVWRDQLIQMGEVIVGTPCTPQRNGATSESAACDCPCAAVDQESLSPEAAVTSDERGARIVAPAHRSPDVADGHDGTPVATPVGVAEAAKKEGTQGNRQLDADVSSALTVTDVPARDHSVYAAHDAASDQLEGADDEQDNH